MEDAIITLKDGKTIKLIDLFKEFNNLYFNGGLYRPFLHIFDGKRECSMVNFKRRKKGKPIRTLGIACNIDWTEENLRNVMLREMASLYVMSTASSPIEKYGKEFKDQIDELNSKYGLSLSAEEYRFEFNYKPKPYFLRCILKLINLIKK